MLRIYSFRAPRPIPCARRALFADFSQVEIRTVLTHSDLLESAAGQRHRGALLTLARKAWPRRLILWLLPKAGLFMLIEAKK